MNMTPVSSSMLSEVGYDPATQILQCRFNAGGKLYRYAGVDQATYTAMRASDSVGKFFLANIKPNFPGELISEE